MATRKTAIFTLTERLTISAGATETFATIDLGSYIDVGDKQGLQVHGIDYIFQGTTGSEHVEVALAADDSVLVQVTDLNRGGLVFANDRALVSSASLYKSAAGELNMEADQYPDNYGKGSDDGRFVVNDQLYITGLATQVNSSTAVNVTVRVSASIVKLSSADFMSIAIQSTAADN
ncbi:MAG: hypothetical protein ACR2NI_04590 [Pirellulales bacterium]